MALTLIYVKLLIALIFSLGIAVCGYAQPNMLGKSEEQVTEKMNAITSAHLVPRMPSEDGKSVIQYIDDSWIHLVYFFEQHKCVLYRIVYPNKYMPDIIDQMSKDNYKKDSTHWMAKDKSFRVEMITNPPIENSFYLEFESLK